MAEWDIKVLCFGAASQDVFLSGKALAAKRDVRTANYIEQFPLGAKIDVEQVVIDTGGGAHNAAVTFARQGLNVAFAGKVGHDPAGAEVVRVLKKEGINADRVVQDPKLHTSYSTILLAPSGERAILNFRGASHDLKANEFGLDKLEGDWMYISSLAGNLDLLGKLIKTAEKNRIRVALNPGRAELAQIKKLRKLLPKVEVLLANKEEMRLIFGGETAKDILLRGFGTCHYIVLTDGPSGTYATDGDKMYFAGLYQKVKVIDRTGAGDAFGSGFVAALAKGLAVEDALTLGSANSTSVVKDIGAKTGILRARDLRRMKIKTLSL